MVENQYIIHVLLITESLPQAEAWSNNVRERSYAIHASRNEGYVVRTLREDTIAGVINAIERQRWDVIVVSADQGTLTVLEVLDAVSSAGKDSACIAVTDDLTMQTSLYNMPLQGVFLARDGMGIGLAVMREFSSLVAHRQVRQLKQTIAATEERQKLLLADSVQATAYLHDGMHLFANASYLAMFGYDSLEILLNTPFLDLISASEQKAVKMQLRQVNDGSYIETETSSARYRYLNGEEVIHEFTLQQRQFNGEACIQICFVAPTASAKLSQISAKETSDIGKETGLLPRRKILAHLTTLVHLGQSGNSDAAAAYFALENIDQIKERIGLGEMDSLMVKISNVLLPNLLEGEQIGRFADGVFLMVSTSVHDDEIDMRLKALQQKIISFSPVFNDQEIILQCSVGVARLGEQTESVSTALSQLDLAWMAAVEKGSNQLFRHKISPSQQGEESADKARLAAMLVADELALTYLPITALQGDVKKMYEVSFKSDLVDDLAGLIAQTRMSGVVDKWVIAKILSTLAKTSAETLFFITLSEGTLIETANLTWLHTNLKKYPTASKQIIFQISDNIALKQAKSIGPAIKLLSKQGFQFALHDFGTGMDFSKSLEIFDVSYLKINGAFVANMGSEADSQEAVTTIVSLIQKAGKISIAAQVSDAQSMALLWGLNVDYAQGDYIQPPMRAPDYNFSGGEV